MRINNQNQNWPTSFDLPKSPVQEEVEIQDQGKASEVSKVAKSIIEKLPEADLDDPYDLSIEVSKLQKTPLSSQLTGTTTNWTCQGSDNYCSGFWCTQAGCG